MKFSIIIPTYNGAAYIEQAILSALQQTRQADEIIISDDNSTDGTLSICDKYAHTIKIHQNPRGPSGFVNGWNNAIAKATGDYISILHQDDTLAPSFLEEAEKALAEYPEIKHLFAPCNYIDENSTIIQESDYCNGETVLYTGQEYVKAYQTIGHPHIHRCPGVITHRTIFKQCQYRKEAGHIADDDFFYRVGRYTNIVGILKPLASYRLHKFSETGHLGNSKLIARLADDYIFQIKEWRAQASISEELLYYFTSKAIHFVFNEYFWGIKENNCTLISKAKADIKLLKQLNVSLPIKMKLFIIVSNLIGRNATNKIIEQVTIQKNKFKKER